MFALVLAGDTVTSLDNSALFMAFGFREARGSGRVHVWTWFLAGDAVATGHNTALCLALGFSEALLITGPVIVTRYASYLVLIKRI